MTPKYQIGETIFWGCYESSENYVECPDCGGTGRLRVTFHDETQVSVDCQNCSRGYLGPCGKIRVYDRMPRVKSGKISGVEICHDGQAEYKVSHSAFADDGRMYTGCYSVKEDSVCRNEDDAMNQAMILCEKDTAEERNRIFRKEKDHRSWAWNASYHRRCIKDAEEKIKYHGSKLAVASLKAKEDKKANIARPNTGIQPAKAATPSAPHAATASDAPRNAST